MKKRNLILIIAALGSLAFATTTVASPRSNQPITVEITNHTPVNLDIHVVNVIKGSCGHWNGKTNYSLKKEGGSMTGTISYNCGGPFMFAQKFQIRNSMSYAESTCAYAMGSCSFQGFNFPLSVNQTGAIIFTGKYLPNQDLLKGDFYQYTKPLPTQIN